VLAGVILILAAAAGAAALLLGGPRRRTGTAEFTVSISGDGTRESPLVADLGGGVSFGMVEVPAGRFVMGSEHGSADEYPAGEVEITRPFCVGACEVTQAAFERVTGAAPWHEKGIDLPATMVSWEDAQDFCRALSVRSGRVFRLPTEAEWEYAARAGEPAPRPFGPEAGAMDARAWTAANSAGSARPVGSKVPNAWGIYDALGNVWEWCADWYAEDAYDSRAPRDPAGPRSGSERVMRGGSFEHVPFDCRPARRMSAAPSRALADCGFRVVLEKEP
jgi:formylglycine-generating enzyme required for sulfatase activity